ncbi:hypothetical protein WJX73_002713 [Symbiochloris irregularis]|uniref:Multiple inositol polyphosphate phosphatase 1 n=1 Tax=Symbiochloris irregularis TaxID=706552 RepID=A0AAW1P2I3_9CHLO
MLRSWRQAVAALLTVLVAALMISSKLQSGKQPQLYSSRTPYSTAVKLMPGSAFNHNSLSQGSEPIFAWVLLRHGTRWPTEKRLQELQKLQPLLQRAGIQAEQWLKPFTGVDHLAGQLHEIGRQEMEGLGKRWASALPELFQDPSSVHFRSSAKQRAMDSATAFVHAMFPDAASVPIPYAPVDNDPLLRFFKLCSAYTQYKQRVKRWMEPWRSQILAEMAPSVHSRLRLPQNATVGPKEVASLWLLCCQQAVLNNSPDAACSLFTAEERAVLEWVDDESLFQTRSHAARVAYHMAAPLVADIAEAFAAAAAASLGSQEDQQERARVYFAHAETIIPLAAALGLFGSPGCAEDACSDSMCMGPEGSETHAAALLKEQVGAFQGRFRPSLPRPPRQRSWRGAEVTPFSAGLALVLYKCPGQQCAGQENGSLPAGHCVRLVYNEHVQSWPGSFLCNQCG